MNFWNYLINSEKEKNKLALGRDLAQSHTAVLGWWRIWWPAGLHVREKKGYRGGASSNSHGCTPGHGGCPAGGALSVGRIRATATNRK
jgi:hypothetical protein